MRSSSRAGLIPSSAKSKSRPSSRGCRFDRARIQARIRLHVEALEQRSLLAGLGLVADDLADRVNLFEPDSFAVLGSVAVPSGPAIGDVVILADGSKGFVTNFDSKVFPIDLTTPTVPVVGAPILIANPGEDISKAISINGQPYTALPNAFKFKQEYNPACSCKRPGESWADALKHLDDRQTVLERGDIIVTEERAKVMNAPRDAKGRPIVAPKNSSPAVTQAAAPAAVGAETPTEASQKPIRSVGPKFLPTQ